MTSDTLLFLVVRETEDLAPKLRRVVLAAEDGAELPVFGPGAHLVLHLQGEDRVWKNAYSLACPPGRRGQWQIVVRRAETSRGGSAFVHERLKAGDRVRATPPDSLLPIAATARRHVLLAGGIGITPFLSFLPMLETMGAAWDLHLVVRADERDAFARLLAPYPQAHLHSGRADFDLPELLAGQKLGTHLYVCGPTGFMDAALTTARRLGWPEGNLHRESFGAAASGAPFRAVLVRAGLTVEVAADQSLLEAIEAAGIDAPSLCRGGACGVCRADVLEGEPDHQDSVLTEAERAANRCIMPCVSRARSPQLVLDI